MVYPPTLLVYFYIGFYVQFFWFRDWIIIQQEPYLT